MSFLFLFSIVFSLRISMITCFFEEFKNRAKNLTVIAVKSVDRSWMVSTAEDGNTAELLLENVD